MRVKERVSERDREWKRDGVSETDRERERGSERDKE